MSDQEEYDFVQDVQSTAWDSLESVRDYILEAARLVDMPLRQTEWRPARGRAVYKCSFYRRVQCRFRIIIARSREHTVQERFSCTVENEHSGHEEGPLLIQRHRQPLSQWVRQQTLTFDNIKSHPHLQPAVRDSLQLHNLGPTIFRPIDIVPVDPSTVGHISLDRWYEGTGDGYEALDIIFNRGDSLLDIGLYVAQHEAEYMEIYGEHDVHYFVDAYAALNDGEVMSDEMAQFMVDRMQQALILCQVDPDVPGDSEISLLVPRFYPENGCAVANRCLINYQGRWSVGDWSLHGREGIVPLYGLPVMNSFWRQRFWAKRGSPMLAQGFEIWGMYASHDPFRNRPDLVR